MRGYLLSIWSILDPLYFKCSRLTYLPQIGTSRNIFRVRLTKYKGKNITLSDGLEIHKNDTLLKIHLHNVRLLKELKVEKNEFKKVKMIYQYVQHSLPGIERYIREHKNSKQIKGIVGITTLNKGCEKLGFEVFSIHSRIYKWFRWTTSLLITLLSLNNNSNRKNVFNYHPSYLIMSKEKLKRHYRYSKKGDC